MKRLIFGKDLVPTAGDRFTVRRFRHEAHAFVKGEQIIGEFLAFGDYPLLILQNTFIASFLELQSSERLFARRGFYFDEAHFKSLKAYYTDLSWNDIGAVIFFRVNGQPVISTSAEPSPENQITEQK